MTHAYLYLSIRMCNVLSIILNQEIYRAVKVFPIFLFFPTFAYLFYTECYQMFNQNLILDKGNPSEQITQQLHTCFIYFINKVMHHPMPPCEKVIAPLHSVTGFCHLWLQRLQPLLEVVDQSLTSLWRNFGPLFHAALL